MLFCGKDMYCLAVINVLAFFRIFFIPKESMGIHGNRIVYDMVSSVNIFSTFFQVVPAAPVKKSLWQRFVDELKHYKSGFVLLFVDIKVSVYPMQIQLTLRELRPFVYKNSLHW